MSEQAAQLATLIISWDRAGGQATWNIIGMSHTEAQRVLMGVAQANLELALAEGQPSPPAPLPLTGEGGGEL